MRLTRKQLRGIIVAEAREMPSWDAASPLGGDWVKEFPEDEGHGVTEHEPVELDADQRDELEAWGYPVNEFTIEHESGNDEEGRWSDLIATHPSGVELVWDDGIGAWVK